MSSDLSLAKQFKNIISDYQKEVSEKVESALDDASKYMEDQLAAQSPRNSGGFSQSWDRKMQYKRVRYIGNTKVTDRPKKFSHQKGGIPLSSLLEYGIKGRPFIKRTFNAHLNKTYQIFVKKMGG
jgi:hypothetical protein